MMTPEEHKALLQCTVTRNLAAAKEAAEFQAFVLPQLTPDQADAHPSSSAFLRALSGCYVWKNGEQLPFDLHGLVKDWSSYFGVTDVQHARLVKQAADCVARADKKAAKAYLKSTQTSSLAHVPLLTSTRCDKDALVVFLKRKDFNAALTHALGRK